MSKIVFFRTPKPKGFSYKPLYYNESKERIEKLRHELDSESSTDSGTKAEEFGVRLREKLDRVRKTRTSNQSGQNFRVFLILIGLLFLFYLLIKPMLGSF